MKPPSPNLTKVAFPKCHTKSRLSHHRSHKATSFRYYPLGLMLQKNATLTFPAFEATRRALRRILRGKQQKNKKHFKLIKSAFKQKADTRIRVRAMRMRLQFSLGLTRKPNQMRMGKGKGSLSGWVYPYSRGRPLWEFSPRRLKMRKILTLLNRISPKLPSPLKLSITPGSPRRPYFLSRLLPSAFTRRPALPPRSLDFPTYLEHNYHRGPIHGRVELHSPVLTWKPL